MYMVGALAVFIMIVALVGVGVGIVFYILKSLGLMRMAERRGIPNAWMGWIPFADMFLYGSIADDVNLKLGGKSTQFRYYALAASIVNIFTSSNYVSNVTDILEGNYNSYNYSSLISFNWGSLLSWAVILLYVYVFYMILQDYKPETAKNNAIVGGIISIIFFNIIFLWIFFIRNKISISSQNGSNGNNRGYGNNGTPGGPNMYGSGYVPPQQQWQQPNNTPPQQQQYNNNTVAPQQYNNVPPQQQQPANTPSQPPQSSNTEGYNPTSASPYNPENQKPEEGNKNNEE